jgi:hypothetical protein
MVMTIKKVAGGVSLLAALAAMITFLPDIKRYLRMRAM